MAKKKLTQLDLLLGYYKRNPGRDIGHPEIVDWATREWRRRTGDVFRDPDRGIRRLHQDGYLIKVRKGVYKYEPDLVNNRTLEDFDAKTRKKILKRDDFRCVVCGRGKREGVELHVDHVKPKDRGGKATVDNGQTLCSQHNFLKKNMGQTTLGKRYFIRLLKTAKKSKDQNLVKFCEEVLKLFDEYDIDTHIKK